MREYLRENAAAPKERITKEDGVPATLSRELFDKILRDGKFIAADGGFTVSQRLVLDVQIAA